MFNEQLGLLAIQMQAIKDKDFSASMAEFEAGFLAVTPAAETLTGVFDDGNVGLGAFSASMFALTGELGDQLAAWEAASGATEEWNAAAEQVDFWASQNTITLGSFAGSMAVLNTEAGNLDDAWAGVVGETEAFAAAAEQATVVTGDKLVQLSESAKGFGQALQSNVAGAFESLMTGKAVTFKSFMQGLFKDLAAQQAKLMAADAISGAFGGGGGKEGGGSKSLVGGLVSSVIGSFFGGAKKNAGGGVTHGVEIAGEAGPEAVVPLPSGGQIPVKIHGGGASKTVVVNFNVSALDTQSAAQVILGNKGAIKSVIAEAMASDVGFSRNMRG